MVSVLFARKDSIYKSLNCDVWDIERDARNYKGKNSVIAHPPCRAWGQLRAFAKPREDEKELAVFAVGVVRKYGGILEHPRSSTLWEHCNLPKPKDGVDEFGGFTICIDQYWFGHLAKKNTLLYIVGCRQDQLPGIPLNFDAVQYVINSRQKKYQGRIKKEVTKKKREETPEDFAKWLINVANICNENLKTKYRKMPKIKAQKKFFVMMSITKTVAAADETEAVAKLTKQLRKIGATVTAVAEASEIETVYQTKGGAL